VAVHVSTLANIEARLSKLEQLVPERSISARNHLEYPIGGEIHVGDGDAHVIESEAMPETHTTIFIQSLTGVQRTLPDQNVDRTVKVASHQLLLPDRATSDDLIDFYARHVYPLFPVIHLPSFRRSYELLWQQVELSESPSLSIDQTVLYANLNMVFALGRLNSTYTKPELTMKQADTYYERARQLVQLDAIDKLTLGTVQYGLMTAQYLLSTKRGNRCHAAVGVAIRAAQSLKLDAIAETAAIQRDREIAKRIWHSCVMTERYVSSMTVSSFSMLLTEL
jgi:hypothetical protein